MAQIAPRPLGFAEWEAARTRMSISTQSFQSILERARVGQLQLPEFQRDYVWNRGQVIELFDSLRQKYPIGALLFMEQNPNVGIVPRPFNGTEHTITTQTPEAFVLDGQQRITSGLSVYYGLGPSQYYIRLDLLWKIAEQKHLKLSDDNEIQQFLNDLDTEDGYCVARRTRTDPMALLDRHLLFTGVLSDNAATRDALKRYVIKYPEREEFIDAVVRDGFKLGADVYVPVTEVERSRPVEAISRIFATLNTTGRPLTPFELVVAILYPSGIRLRTEIDTNRQIAPHYDHMDYSGEVFLQTIALLANASPKKSQLPRTIKPEIFRLYANEAVDILEKLGILLTQRLGVGLDQSSELIPYDSIFAPMAIALKHLNGKSLKGAVRATAERKLEKWFIVSALDNRYQEGVHNKQVTDKDEMIAWIDDVAGEPDWMATFQAGRLTLPGPDGAVGKLLRCLINLQKPTDPVTHLDVGTRPTAVSTAKHHIFPTRWVDKYLVGWDTNKDSNNLALNVMTVSQETNIRWVNVDPANQLQEMRDASASMAALKNCLAANFLNDDCVFALSKPDKTKQDFEQFLKARELMFLDYLKMHWGIMHSHLQSDSEEDDGAGHQ